MSLKTETLEKKRRPLLNDVDTVKISCENKKITGKNSIKSSRETGMGVNDFVHVIKSVMTEYNKPVVVKIHDASSSFIQKELFALYKLENFQNSVKIICDFSCMDDKERWKNPVPKPVKFCNNKKDSLHFIVLEYIEDGGIEQFFNRNPSKEEVCSIMIQLELSVITLALDYNISHGDLNPGNILFSKTDEEMVMYNVLGEEYSIKSFGIIPKFIDYGRLTEYEGKKQEKKHIIDDIHFILTTMNVFIYDTSLKIKFREWIHKEFNKRSLDFHKIIDDTEKFFKKL